LAASKALSLLICFVSWWQPLRGKGESEACKCPDQYECVYVCTMYIVHTTLCVCVCVCVQGADTPLTSITTVPKKSYHSPSLPI
jgi:hypothetical protein